MTLVREAYRTSSDPARAAIYAPIALAQVPRLLSKLDREPFSRSYGNFDRENWAWKFRDFPIGVLQWAGVLPLAWLWQLDLPESPWRGSAALLQWTRAALRELLRRQHPNGAFDSVGPYTQDHGASLAACYYLSETARTLGAALSDEEHERIRRAIARAIDFAGRATEDYAYISNHHALFALGLVSAGDWCAEPQWRERADETVREILAHQSPDGFYEEYGGNDPGYESLGIDFLSRIWARTGEAALLDSLRRAVQFYAFAPLPDGSLGGALGSRHTRLWFPAGFERLAAVVPEAAAVAEFMRERLALAEVVTPAIVDAQNLPVMLGSYLAACQVLDPPARAAAPPCLSLHGTRSFSAGTHVVGTDHYYALVALHKGGLMRVVSRDSAHLAYEDAGWIVRSEGRTYSSQLLGLSRFEGNSEASSVVVHASFGLVRQEQLTPLRFVVLRILNLTVFRSLTLGNWVRRLLIGRLITSVTAAPITLERRITFLANRVDVLDTLRLRGAMRVDSVELVRSFTGIHMGSAKYFHPSESRPLKLPRAAGLAEKLPTTHVGELRFSVRFGAEGASIDA